MFMARRKHGSQRAMASVTLDTTMINTDDVSLTFRGDDGVWYSIVPENLVEVKKLLSAVHVLHHNFED